MRHVISLQGHGKAVHLAGANSHSLCGGLSLRKTVEGVTYEVVADTGKAVNCRQCHKALEMLIRRCMENVQTSLLEHILETIT